MKKIGIWGAGLMAGVLSRTGLADYGSSARQGSLGDVAYNIVHAENSIHGIIQFLCLMAGIGMLASSLFFFQAYWKNPKHVPISRPIATVVLGLALLVLAYLPMWN